MINKDLLAEHYQYLLQVCLTAGAADMRNYCLVNSSAQVAGEYSCQAYLSVYVFVANLQRLNYRIGKVSKSMGTSYSCHRSALIQIFEAGVHRSAEF